MQPIAKLEDLRPGTVLHHSALGFARVRAIDETEVALDWASDDPNLPATMSGKSLRKAWSRCIDGGFFARALDDRDALIEALNIQPGETLRALLAELDGEQQVSAIREWMAECDVLSNEGFDRWWKTVLTTLTNDDALELEGESIALREAAVPLGLREQLERTESVSERIELAITHHEELGAETVDDVLFAAWISGRPAIRDLVLSHLSDREPNAIVHGLLEAGGDPTEALTHAVLHGEWGVDALAENTQLSIATHIVRRLPADAPLDAEGRLAAAMIRGGSKALLASLSDCAAAPDGQRLVRATLAAMSDGRSAQVVADLFETAYRLGDTPAAEWLATLFLDGLGLEDEQVAAVIEERGENFRSQLASHHRPRPAYEEEGLTAELDLSALVYDPIPLVDVASEQRGAGFIALALSLARALSTCHHRGEIIEPSRESVWLLPDGTVEFRPADLPGRRPLEEPPSTAGDVYSAAVVLLEMLCGRPWPEGADPGIGVPYIRGVAPDLPPSVLGPLDAALHPDPLARPRDGLAWLLSWQACAVAEDRRLKSSLNLASRFHVGYDSHVGRMKVLFTQTNQDALFVAERSGVTLFVVCDGISTATAGSGDVASGITAHVVSSLWEQALTRLRTASVPETEDFLSRAFRMANQAVCEAALRFAGGRLHGRVPMGTTAVVGIGRGNRVTLAWLGDSRAYLVGPYGTSLLTADMNQAGDRLVGWSRGELPHWESNGYALVGYVGHFDEAYTAIPLQPALTDLYLLPGERLVICSDGVTDYASNCHAETAARIGRAVKDQPCDSAARALIELANRGGGGDNATAIVTSLREL